MFTFGIPMNKRSCYNNIFMDGEITNKKKSPEEAELIVRQELTPSQYVTSKQIQALFSNFASKLKAGTLKPPTPKDEDEVIEVMDNQTANKDRNNENYFVDLSDEVQVVMGQISDWEIGEYVAVHYGNHWYPGEISTIHDDGRFGVKHMTYVDKLNHTNKFRWIENDLWTCDKIDLILRLSALVEVSLGKRYGHYKLSDSDFDFLNSLRL